MNGVDEIENVETGSYEISPHPEFDPYFYVFLTIE